MAVYVTTISAVKISDDGKIDVEIDAAIIKCLNGEEPSMQDKLLREAKSKWSFIDGYRMHEVGKFKRVSKAYCLKMAEDADD